MPTIKDVAKEAGVSIATVSYVLNEKTDMVSADTYHHVRETARQLGYRPNITARNLKQNRTRLVGYAWHTAPENHDNPVMNQFIYYLAQAAGETQHHLLTFTHPAKNPLPVYDEIIRSGRLDGFVVASTVYDDARIRFLMDSGFPYVCFGRSNADWNFPWVDVDGYAGVREAVEYLIEIGHRRIAMFAWEEESISGNFRLNGYLDALQNAGIAVPPEYVIRSYYLDDTIDRTFSAWDKLPASERPTAVIAVSDTIAVGVMSTARHYGYEIGKSLSIIGFDDAVFGQYLNPALSTLQQPLRQISQLLMDMLETILGNQPPETPHVLLAPKLIIRGSSGPPEAE